MVETSVKVTRLCLQVFMDGSLDRNHVNRWGPIQIMIIGKKKNRNKGFDRISTILMRRTARRFRIRHQWTMKRRFIPSHILPISVTYQILSSLFRVLFPISPRSPLTLFFQDSQPYLPSLLHCDTAKALVVGWGQSTIFVRSGDGWMLFDCPFIPGKALNEKVYTYAIISCPHSLTLRLTF
jgi:hypothetical protein